MFSSSGTDGFHVPSQPYVQQQQPNQPGNQAQTLRGIAPTGPPNQPSTPPTNDLKVSQVQQQQSMNHMVSIGPSPDNWVRILNHVYKIEEYTLRIVKKILN